jgi:hypothetical protein
VLLDVRIVRENSVEDWMDHLDAKHTKRLLEFVNDKDIAFTIVPLVSSKAPPAAVAVAPSLGGHETTAYFVTCGCTQEELFQTMLMPIAVILVHIR